MKERFIILTATDKETAGELSRQIKFGFILGRASTLGFASAESKKS